ncbi:uncharacterized protein DUF4244 [Kitasatospora sp. SolWspMP-SS2h]|uniref:DUF4244 domain-containing protein n=1 Tax=Kitasatospora sp. SolWspMP-SS2h TaxID=1305729 RepID=UPI000DBA7D6A|nr:DUF4244 domain-containing protein [Kitasatospora sp. SolWspMP-SS2h]RAJ42307.1 uncharacterized protein DUF4244 [Kitasatospora sp. SolWspMP-SS2h]
MKKLVGVVRPAAVVLAVRRCGGWFRHRYRRVADGPQDAGMSTAEYAIGTVAACAFAAVLYKVVTSGTVSGALSEILERALHAV